MHDKSVEIDWNFTFMFYSLKGIFDAGEIIFALALNFVEISRNENIFCLTHKVFT